MTGSSSREQTFVLAAAMAQKPKRVIWEVDDWIFHDTPDIDANVHLPADLYRGNARGIASYLLDGAMAREAAVDCGAIDPAAGADRREADERSALQIPGF